MADKRPDEMTDGSNPPTSPGTLDVKPPAPAGPEATIAMPSPDAPSAATVGISPPANREVTAPAQRIAGYEVLKVLGRGAMGIVYQARHLSLNRVVALKMILSGIQAGTAERIRFQI